MRNRSAQRIRGGRRFARRDQGIQGDGEAAARRRPRSDQTLGEFANRFTGSADLYQDDGRRPYASVNFVTAHDGFTLRDRVSYNEKHNDANGENNQDGESHNRSWNCGAEGSSDDPAVNELRARQQRNFITTLPLFNAHHEPLEFTLPPAAFGKEWDVAIDTTTAVGEREAWCTAGATVTVAGRAVLVLRRDSPP